MKISSEAKIGFVVIVAIGLLVWGLNFLKGTNIFSGEREYYAIYSRINSLVEGNPIQLNGHKIGQVSKVYFHPDKSGKIVVRFNVSKETIDLPRDSEAQIFSSDLLGSKAINLKLGTDTSFLENGDTLSSDVEMDLTDQVNQQIAPLKRKTEELIASVDSAVVIVQEILNKDARENLGKGFESIKKSFKKFENVANDLEEMVDQNKGKINDIFSKVQSIVNNFNDNNAQLSLIMNNLSMITDSIAKADFATTLQNVNHALKATSEIMVKVNNGQGTLGQLLNDDKLYNELSMAAIDLNLLLLEIRKNPGKYMPFKKKRKDVVIERDSIYYRNMMEMDSVIIHKHINSSKDK